jgi:hypothetical protein
MSDFNLHGLKKAAVFPAAIAHAITHCDDSAIKIAKAAGCSWQPHKTVPALITALEKLVKDIKKFVREYKDCSLGTDYIYIHQREYESWEMFEWLFYEENVIDGENDSIDRRMTDPMVQVPVQIEGFLVKYDFILGLLLLALKEKNVLCSFCDLANASNPQLCMDLFKVAAKAKRKPETRKNLDAEWEECYKSYFVEEFCRKNGWIE